jgi:uncharacterized membrane protein
MRGIRIGTALVSLTALLVLFTAPAYADVNSFTITKFNSDQTLTNDDPQGVLHIVETIDVVFTDNNHGILRAIPAKYQGNTLKFHLNSITSNSGAPTSVSTYGENGNTVLKIGDPNKTVTGAQSYTIDYTLNNVITFYDDHDELYWDVNGDQWDQPVNEVTMQLHLPSGLTLSADQPKCFAGAYGLTEGNCVIQTNGASEITATATELSARQTLTYVSGFTKGYFQSQTTSEKIKDNLNILVGAAVGLIGLPLIALVTGFSWWWRRGRDAPGKGVIVPQYEPPKDITPLSAGLIANFTSSNRDITAMIIDLARRGYLKIHETRKDRLLLKDKVTYSLELAKNDTAELSNYESDLIDALFPGKQMGEKKDLGTYNKSLYTYQTDLKKKLDAELKAAGYFTKNPFKISRKVWLPAGGIVLVSLIVGLVVHEIPLIIVGLVVAGLIMGIFISWMPARTPAGVAVKEHLEGLKLYMNTVDKERLEKLESPNAAYASGAGEPTRTVELFEKLLPYAIVLGVEEGWAKQFAHLYTTPPSWYDGTSNNFNSIYFASALNSGLGSSLNSSFTPPSSSGSSGFSGGGFSGGGGGGGGGGGW